MWIEQHLIRKLSVCLSCVQDLKSLYASMTGFYRASNIWVYVYLIAIYIDICMLNKLANDINQHACRKAYKWHTCNVIGFIRLHILHILKH